MDFSCTQNVLVHINVVCYALVCQERNKIVVKISCVKKCIQVKNEAQCG